MTRPIDRFVLIIGAMKSGTTFLDAHLRQHPQIAGNAASKEPNFFAFDSEYQRGLNYYLDQWDFDHRRHVYALESSTTYTQYPVYPDVPERIRAMDPDVRLIYILRHPVDRIESQLAHAVAYAWLSIDRESGRILAGQRRAQYRNALNYSRYAMQLDRYSEILPRTPILLLDFDRLRSQTEHVLKTVLNFLELEDFEFRILGRENPRKARYGSQLIHLSEKEREMFTELLRPDVRKLSGRYGFETKHWQCFD